MLDNRNLFIIKTLEINNVKISDLSNAISVSERTLRNDIKEINFLLRGGAYIDLRSDELSIYIYDQIIYKKILKKLTTRENDFTNQLVRINYIFLKLVNNKFVIIDDLADEMNVSNSTVNKDLIKARQRLNAYHIKIRGRPNVGITLIGKEIDIRNYILENAYENFVSNSYLSEKYYIFLYDLLTNYYMSHGTIEKLSKYIAVSLLRVKDRNFISNDDILNREMDPSLQKLYEIIATQIYNEEDLNLPKSEMLYIMTPVIGMRTPSNLELIEDVRIERDVLKLVYDILERIRKDTDINVDLGDITDKFTYHIYFLINRVKLDYKLDNPLIDVIKKDYKVAYKLAEISAEVIEDYLKKKINVAEISYLASYFQIYLFSKLNKSKTHKLRIGIVNTENYDKGNKNVINRIYIRLGNDVNIHEYHDTKMINNSLEYDLVITNANIEINSDSIIYVPSLENIDLIQKEIDDFYYKKQYIKKNKFINSVIIDNLSNETFFVLEGNNYNENLNYVLNELSRRSISDDEFKRSLLKKEENSASIFAEGIAFPHVKSNKLILALIISPNSRTKLTIIAGIPSVDDTLIINLYDEVVSLSTHSYLMEHITEIKNYEEFIEFIIRETNLFRQ